jgi:choline monooxygenase
MTAIATLPAGLYCDPDNFAAEQKHIFRRHWMLVAHLGQLAAAGDFVAANIAGQPIFVMRDRDDALRGFHNVCRHRASPLLLGASGKCGVLRCPYHGWVYDQDGKLRKAPGFEDEALDGDEWRLHPVRVESWNGLVFACLDNAVPSLVDWLGDIVPLAAGYAGIATLRYFGETRHDATTDWKAYGDNSCEGYHLSHVHKTLSAMLVKERTRILPVENGQFVRFDVVYDRGDGSLPAPGVWIYKFPATLMVLSTQSATIDQVIPLAAGKMRIFRWLWLAPERNDGEAALASADAILREDMAISDLVQRNLAAGVYECGILSSDREPGTIAFQRWYREAMAA